MGKTTSGSGGAGTSTVTTTNEPPQAFLDAYNNLVSRATTNADAPLTQYADPLVAGFTPYQNQAFFDIASAQGLSAPFTTTGSQQFGAATQNLWQTLPSYDTSALPGAAAAGFGTAQQYGQAAAQPIGQQIAPYADIAAGAAQNLTANADPYAQQAYGQNLGQNASAYADIARGAAQNLPANAYPYAAIATQPIQPPEYSTLGTYISPYTQQVTNAMQDLFAEQNAEQYNKIRGNAAAQGAFGGNREAVAQAEAARQQQLAQNPQLAQVLQQGFQQAQNELNTQQQMEIQRAQAQGQLGLGAGQLINQAGVQQGQLGLGAGQLLTQAGQAQGQLGLGAGQLVNQAGLQQGQLGLGAGQLVSGALGTQGQLGLGAAQTNLAAGQGYGSMFDKQQAAQAAAQQANAWLASQAGAGYGGLGAQAQNQAMSGAGALQTVGALQQQLEQEQLNIPYEQFLQQQAYPFQTTNFLAPIVEGAGSQSGGSGVTTSTAPGPSTLSQVAGLGLTGLGAVGLTGGFGAGGWLSGLLGLGRGGRANPYAVGGAVDDDETTKDWKLPKIPKLNVDYIKASNPVLGKGPPVAPQAVGGLSATPYSPTDTLRDLSTVKGLGGFDWANKSANAGDADFTSGWTAPSIYTGDASRGGRFLGGGMVRTMPGDNRNRGFHISVPHVGQAVHISHGLGSRAGTYHRPGLSAKFEDGGLASPLMASSPLAGASPNSQNYSQQLADMPMEKLQELAVRVPPGTSSGDLVQRALQAQKMTPGAGLGLTPDQKELGTGLGMGMGAGFGLDRAGFAAGGPTASAPVPTAAAAGATFIPNPPATYALEPALTSSQADIYAKALAPPPLANAGFANFPSSSTLPPPVSRENPAFANLPSAPRANPFANITPAATPNVGLASAPTPNNYGGIASPTVPNIWIPYNTPSPQSNPLPQLTPTLTPAPAPPPPPPVIPAPLPPPPPVVELPPLLPDEQTGGGGDSGGNDASGGDDAEGGGAGTEGGDTGGTGDSGSSSGGDSADDGGGDGGGGDGSGGDGSGGGDDWRGGLVRHHRADGGWATSDESIGRGLSVPWGWGEGERIPPRFNRATNDLWDTERGASGQQGEGREETIRRALSVLRGMRADDREYDEGGEVTPDPMLRDPLSGLLLRSSPGQEAQTARPAVSPPQGLDAAVQASPQPTYRSGLSAPPAQDEGGLLGPKQGERITALGQPLASPETPASDLGLGRAPPPSATLRPPSSAPSSDLRQQTVDWWTKNGGVSPVVAEGIARAINRESSFRPDLDAPDRGGPSTGLYQAHLDRRTDLMKNPNWKDPAVQHQWALGQVTGGDPIATAHWDEIKAAKTPEEADKLWDRYFERSAAGPGSARPNVSANVGMQRPGEQLLSGYRPDARPGGDQLPSDQQDQDFTNAQGLGRRPPRERGTADTLLSSPWMIPLAIGSGLLASRSPYPGVALGEGLQTGIKVMANQQGVENKQEIADMRGEYQERLADIRGKSVTQKGEDLVNKMEEIRKKNAFQQEMGAQTFTLKQQLADAATLRAEAAMANATSAAGARDANEKLKEELKELRKSATKMEFGRMDPNDPNSQLGTWVKPEHWDPDKPNGGATFYPGVGAPKQTGAGTNTFEAKRQAYREVNKDNPNVEQDALDYASGKRAMTPQQYTALVQRQIGLIQANDPALMGKNVTARAEAEVQKIHGHAPGAPAAPQTQAKPQIPPVPDALSGVAGVRYSVKTGKFYGPDNKAYNPNGTPAEP